NKPENQYDTLALEAAYLAHGQSERILQLQQARINLSRWVAPDFSEYDSVRMGACVVLLSENDEERSIFIAPVGGRELEFEGEKILVVNQEAPVTRRLCGLQIGDEVELTLGGRSSLWELLAIH
ncbi:MAG TPA: transcription elongation factor, partial [Oceanospirillales bacterium]|nr:transcription elongation factor [Oceanospirillales bacterium]